MQTITLSGRFVTLEPLEQHHLAGLVEAASDGQLWTLFFTTVPNPDTIQTWFDTAIAQQRENKALPFVVRENFSGKIVGATRYCNVDLGNKRLEIGYTWYAKRVQRSAVNTECKLLLLRHAFEQLHCNVVELRTDWLNHRSQRAIERLGAKRDGVLRNNSILPNGRVRDAVVYSILNSEWDGVQQNLCFKLESPAEPC
jgi:RimJ/RimL family protein N-acetyltransferase